MAIEKITLGVMSGVVDKINNNFSQLPPIIVNSFSPSRKTVAQTIGQQFLNSNTMEIYACSSIAYDESGIANNNTIYEWNLISGKNRYPVIFGQTSPSNSTHAVGLGQLYINQSSNSLYICINISDSGDLYTWYLVAKGDVYPIIVITDGIIGKNIAKGIGQILADFTNNNLYMCIRIEEDEDIWYPINTTSQQIIYCSNEPSSIVSNTIWFKKTATIEKNIDGLTNQLIII